MAGKIIRGAKCLLVSTEIDGRQCPPVSPISPFNAHYEFQKFHSEKKTRKATNKKVHSKTKKCDFHDKEEFTTEKCGIGNGFKAGARSRRAQRKIPKEGLMTLQEGVKDSLAVVKRSSDPYTDFRTSMVEMIVEKQIFTAKELENLLQCFLSLNSYHHHRVIIEVFYEILEAFFVSYV
ncbi:transcription repressor OFP8-like [Olea europaea var. sylvestris]|uniref:transcription repressor OFP8-like n=1 Tax=Olea europaea var. sylvestris TaxID=158386 RepID=UPI000C1D3467|nr:transcription repressor OFP8-like [Olea europaea var. sylvestris]